MKQGGVMSWRQLYIIKQEWKPCAIVKEIIHTVNSTVQWQSPVLNGDFVPNDWKLGSEHYYHCETRHLNLLQLQGCWSQKDKTMLNNQFRVWLLIFLTCSNHLGCKHRFFLMILLPLTSLWGVPWSFWQRWMCFSGHWGWGILLGLHFTFQLKTVL